MTERFFGIFPLRDSEQDESEKKQKKQKHYTQVPNETHLKWKRQTNNIRKVTDPTRPNKTLTQGKLCSNK